MPIGLDPEQTVALTLLSDRAAGRQGPTFAVRFPTPRQQRRVRELMARAVDEANAWLALPHDTDEQAHAMARAKQQCHDTSRHTLAEAAAVMCAGWRGLKDEAGADVPYAADCAILADLLAWEDLERLSIDALRETELGMQDFFASAWRSASTRADGAAAAPGTTAPETTPPTGR